MKLCVLTASILAPGLLLGQSLGDAAAKERERRSKLPASPAPVYTNDTLAATKGQVANDPNAPGGSTGLSGGPPPLAPSGATEATWRERYRQARGRLDAAQVAYDKAAQAPNVPGVRRYSRIGPTSLVRRKAELDEAQQAFDALQEEARKAGVPPGWVR